MSSSVRPQPAHLNLDTDSTAFAAESEEGIASGEAVRQFSPRDAFGGLAGQLAAFVEPLLAEGDGSPEHEQNVLELGRVCWQIALQEPAARAERIREVEEILCSTEEERDALRGLVQSLIERHRAMFPWLHGA